MYFWGVLPAFSITFPGITGNYNLYQQNKQTYVSTTFTNTFPMV